MTDTCVLCGEELEHREFALISMEEYQGVFISPTVSPNRMIRQTSHYCHTNCYLRFQALENEDWRELRQTRLRYEQYCLLKAKLDPSAKEARIEIITAFRQARNRSLELSNEMV